MSPLRAYRCEAGHEFEVMESMGAEPRDACGQRQSYLDVSSMGYYCTRPVTRLIQPTQPPIVKGGMPTHHKGRGV